MFKKPPELIIKNFTNLEKSEFTTGPAGEHVNN